MRGIIVMPRGKGREKKHEKVLLCSQEEEDSGSLVLVLRVLRVENLGEVPGEDLKRILIGWLAPGQGVIIQCSYS